MNTTTPAVAQLENEFRRYGQHLAAAAEAERRRASERLGSDRRADEMEAEAKAWLNAATICRMTIHRAACEETDETDTPAR